MTYRKLKTTKLYYGKWPYKIECLVAGSYRIKRYGIGHTLQFCFSNEDDISYRYYKNNFSKAQKDRLREFANDVEPFLNKEVQIRTESGHFNIFCKDTNLYNRIIRSLKSYISAVYEPASEVEMDFMMNNSHKKVLCNHLPFNQYHYKVYFKPNCDINLKGKLESWLLNYTDKVKIPKGTVLWFVRGWRPAPYIYVADQSTLAMVGLFMGGNIHKVEEFIPRSSINTTLDQEKLCQDSVSA